MTRVTGGRLLVTSFIALVAAAPDCDGPRNNHHHNGHHPHGPPGDPPPDPPGDPGLPACGLDEAPSNVPARSCPGFDAIAPTETVENRPGSNDTVSIPFSTQQNGLVCVDVTYEAGAEAWISLNDDRVFSSDEFHDHGGELHARRFVLAGDHELDVTPRGDLHTATDVGVSEPVPGLNASGYRNRLFLRDFSRNREAISPANQDGRFDDVTLRARLKAWPHLHPHGSIEYAFEVLSADSCEVVWSGVGVIEVATGPGCRDEDDDGDPNHGHGNDPDHDDDDNWGHHHDHHHHGHGWHHGHWDDDDHHHNHDNDDNDDTHCHPEDWHRRDSFYVSATWDGKDDAGAFVPDGNYYVVVSATLLKESHGGSTRVVDSLLSPAWTVHVDNTPPPLTVNVPPACVTNGVLDMEGTTEATAIVLIEHAPAGTTLEPPVAPNGSWSQVVSLVPNAQNVLTVTARDALFNVSPQEVRTVTHDNVAPSVRVDAPEEGALVVTPQVEVSGEATDSSPLDVFVQNALVGHGGPFTTQVSLPLDAQASITVRAVDCAGNETSVTRHVLRRVNCSAHHECDQLAISDPALACSKEGFCSSNGHCQFREIRQPSSFCITNDLWVWNCEVFDVDKPGLGLVKVRMWSCAMKEECGAPRDCSIATCEPGLDSCHVTPASDGAPCAITPAQCVGDSVLQPTCKEGVCSSATGVAVVTQCDSQKPTDDDECWQSTCDDSLGAARCIHELQEGAECGPCGPGDGSHPVDGLEAPCDRCAERYACNGAGICQGELAPSCTSSDPCVRAVCDRFSGDCEFLPWCPSDTTCDATAAGPVCEANP